MKKIEKIWKKTFMMFSKTGAGLINRQKFTLILNLHLTLFLFIFGAKLYFLDHFPLLSLVLHQF